MDLRVHQVYEGLRGQKRVALVDGTGRVYHADLFPVGEPDDERLELEVANIMFNGGYKTSRDAIRAAVAAVRAAGKERNE